jgi:hypothetical protein
MNRSPRSLLTGLAVAGLLATPLVAAAAKPAHPVPQAWSPPLALAGGGAEPGIRVAPDGRSAAYISAPSGLGSNFWRIDQVRNPDGTFSMKAAAPKQPDLGTGGGDAEISVGSTVDPATGCAPIAYSGLHNIDLLDNFTTATSSDCGKTFSAPNLFATQNTLTDRQWQVFDGSKTNHLLYHKVDTGQIVDSISYDAGAHYVTLGTPAGATGVVDANHAYTIQNVKIGNVVVDPHRATGGTYLINGEKQHVLYATFEGVRNAADAAQSQVDGNVPGSNYNHMDTVYVGRSDDGGLTWTDTTSFTTPPTAKKELDLIFPVVGLDAAGNVYSAWTDGNLISYAVSQDGAKTWSKPYVVNPGEKGASKSAGTADIFPWIAAGAKGALDLVWYHGQGGDTSGYRQVGTKDTAWTVAFAQLNGATAKPGAVPHPSVVSRSLAITPVIHRGNVCNNGTTCLVDSTRGNGGDRTLLDYFQVAIDPAGRANIAYAADASSPGTATTTYTRQNTGRSLTTGRPLTGVVFSTRAVQLGSSCPGPQIVDAVGDAPSTLEVGTPTMNTDTLDVHDVRFSSPGTSALTLRLHAKNLSALPPGGATIGSAWTVTWITRLGGKARTFYASASSNAPMLQTYNAGEIVAGKQVSGGTVTGTFAEGPNGTITWNIPRKVVGNPASGTVFEAPTATTNGTLSAQGNGLTYTAVIDRAPDIGGGAPYTLGRC